MYCDQVSKLLCTAWRLSYRWYHISFHHLTYYCVVPLRNLSFLPQHWRKIPITHWLCCSVTRDDHDLQLFPAVKSLFKPVSIAEPVAHWAFHFRSCLPVSRSGDYQLPGGILPACSAAIYTVSFFIPQFPFWHIVPALSVRNTAYSPPAGVSTCLGYRFIPAYYRFGIRANYRYSCRSRNLYRRDASSRAIIVRSEDDAPNGTSHNRLRYGLANILPIPRRPGPNV